MGVIGWGVRALPIVPLTLLVALAGAQPRLRLETGIGHTAVIVSAAFSPDGSRVLTASLDKTARLWDLARGKEIRRFEGHGSGVTSAVFSPDGKWVLTASDDKTARIWDVATGMEIRRFEGHGGSVSCAVFSPDGSQVLTAADKTALLWDVASSMEIRRFGGHGGAVDGAIFSPDGSQVLTASRDKTARLWDVASGKEVRRFDGHRGYVASAVLSPDGSRVLTASTDKTARLWDAAGKELRRFEGHEAWVTSAVFSPDGSQVLTASSDKTARLWDAATGKEVRRFGDHGGAVDSAIFSPDGSQVFIGSADGSFLIWDVFTGKEIRRFEVHGHGDMVSTAAFSPEGSRVVTASYDTTARLWDTATGADGRRFEGNKGWVTSATFSPDGSHVLTASWDETAGLWDSATGKEVCRFLGHAGPVYRAVFSPDAKVVLTASSDQTTRLWDAATGKEIRRFEGHEDIVNSAAFSPEGSRVLTASWDHTARLWDAFTTREIRRFEGHGSGVTSAVFSPDGKWVLTASDDRTARLWETATGKEVRRFEGHGGSVTCAVFSPDGSRVLTASWDKTTRLWDSATGKEIRRFDGHGAVVFSAVFSADGKTVLTASGDGTARVWNTATGKELCSLISYTDGSWAVVDSEGRYDSSDGGKNPNLYWVYEDPAKRILDTIGVDQIGSYFYTPGLLAKCLKREALSEVPDLSKTPIFPRVDGVKVVPSAGLSPSPPSPLSPARGEGEKWAVQFTLTDRGGGIGRVDVFVEGQRVKTAAGKAGKNTIPIGEDDPTADIQVVAYNAANSLASPRSSSTPTNPPPGDLGATTRYVAVIAGIETYAGSASEGGLKPLSYAADDAVAIARSIAELAKGLKLTPEIYVLSSAPEAQPLKKEGMTVLPATKDSFRKVFTEILPAGGRWRSSDLMFLYLSGHGTAYKVGDAAHYAYYTEDARLADLSLQRDKWAVTDVELVQWLAKFPGGKRAMVLDTCAAGAASDLLAQAKDDADRQRAMLDTNRNTGMSVLFGAADSAVSWEINGHGLLTYTLLQALATEKLGQDIENAVRVDTLFAWVEQATRREAERLGLKQEPSKVGRGQDFPLGYLDDSGRKAIPYEAAGVLFGVPKLLNTDPGVLADDLGIGSKLGEALAASSKGGSKVRYLPNSPLAVAIEGGYTASGGNVKLTLSLTPPGKPRVRLDPIEGTAESVIDAAVKAILRWAEAQRTP